MKEKKGIHKIKKQVNFEKVKNKKIVKTINRNKWMSVFSILVILLFVFQLAIIVNGNLNIEKSKVLGEKRYFKNNTPSNGNNQNTSIETERAPYLLEGMEAIYFDENNKEQKLTDPFLNKAKWYNYSQKRWANAKTKDGSYWVWIPTFAYKIRYFKDQEGKVLSGVRDSNGFSTKSTLGKDEATFLSMDIKFISKDIKDLSTFNKNSDYIIHPAFYKGQYISDGFWVAKYKAGEGQNPKYAPNQKMDNNISISEAFKKVEAGTNPGNPYGLDEEYAQMTLPQNRDIGALLYLAMSTKGKGAKDMEPSNLSTTSNKVETSSTGNMSGIFDLNSNLMEWTLSLKENPKYNGAGSEKKNLEAVFDSLKGKRIHERNYKNLTEEYPYGIDKSVNDETKESNEKALEKNRLVNYGDAIYETSLITDEPLQAENNEYLLKEKSFIVRGAKATDKNKYSATYRAHTGKADMNVGYRAALYIHPYNLNKNVTYTFNIPDGKIKIGEEVSTGKKMKVTGTKQSIYPNMITIVDSKKRFKGWEPFNPNGVPMLKDTTFNPIFEENGEPEPTESYEVRFKDPSTERVFYRTNVKYGEKVNMKYVPIPEKEGFKFKRWSPDPTQTTIYSEYEFNAIFEKDNTPSSEMCTVTYRAEQGIFANNAVEYKVKVRKGSYAPYLPEDPNDILNQEVDEKLKNATHPIRRGYLFTGWIPPIDKTIVTHDMVFTATYIEMPDIREDDEMIYKLRMDLNGGHSKVFTHNQTFNIIDLIYGNDTTIIKKEFSKKLLEQIESDKPQKNGMKFSHWELKQNKKDNNEVEFVYKAIYVNESTILEPPSSTHFNYRTVVYDASGGYWNLNGEKTLNRKKYLKSGELLGKMEQPIREGYVFNGWQTSTEQEMRDDSTINESVKLFAKWTNKNDYGTPVDPGNPENPDGGGTYIPDNPNNPFTPYNPSKPGNNNGIGYYNPYNPGTTPIDTVTPQPLPMPIPTDGQRPGIRKPDPNLPDSGLKQTVIGIVTITLITGLITTMYISKRKIQYIDKQGGISAK